MADNVVITAGAGTTIHADEYTHTTLGAGKTQLVKLVDGTLDAEAAIAADVGVKANALRVCPANNITDATYIGDIKFGEAEPNSAAILADTTSIVTAIQLLDNAVDGNYLNVNLNVAGTDVSANAGVLTAQTLRVTIATDDEVNNLLGTIDTDTGVIAGDTTSIDGKITACNTGAVVLATGSAAIGKLAANTGVDIGDVDVLSLPAITLAAAQTLATVTTVGTVTTITNVVHVDDNAGALTVDGTITAELSATDNAVLDAIDTVLDLINAKLVTGTVIGDVNLGATDNAVLDSIVTNTARTPITDYGQAKLDSADVTTAQVLVAAAGAVKFYITSIILSVAAAGSYWIEDDDATQITCKYTLAANGGVVIAFPKDTPYKSTTANKGLKVKGSAAGVIGCQITYYTAA